MFDFLKTIIKINSKIKDIEAKLSPVPGCIFDGVGEVEFEAFEDGCGNIELELERTNVPAGTVVEVVCENVYVGEIHVVGARNKQRIAYPSAETLPQLEAGQTVEMIIDGQVCFAGVFLND